MELQINLKRLVAIGDSELVAHRPVKSLVFCENDFGFADQLCRRAPGGKDLVLPKGWGNPQGARLCFGACGPPSQRFHSLTTD